MPCPAAAEWRDLVRSGLDPFQTVVYTPYFGTDKPRCVVHDFGEEKTLKNQKKYYSLECRYLNFDGEILGEASIELGVSKFRGTKLIRALRFFPLWYYPDHSAVKADLVKCGQNFVSLIDAHHRHCRGSAFYMEEGHAI